jgi:hypothetical protein
VKLIEELKIVVRLGRKLQEVHTAFGVTNI